ncbi:MAG: hypothetical protein LBK44_06725 [Spirochaetales bacterium]|jgi:hypothetical protein|nr:hypothetical protein [Spirochaetales bacterium]
MQKIAKIIVEDSGTLCITIESDTDSCINSSKTFILFFCGWRIKNSSGEILTALFNDPRSEDDVFAILSGKKVKTIWYDKYDCKIETVDGYLIESFALHNDIENKGFYIVDE